MALDTRKLELLLTQMLAVIKEDIAEPIVIATTIEPKKRGRPKGSPKSKAVEQPITKGDGGLFQIKKEKDARAGSRRPLAGQKNLFNPDDYKTCEDEGSAEWNRLKDGGIVKSQKREYEVQCVCEECKTRILVPKELVRENFKCDDCLDKIIKDRR
jgi:hypothetical protein